MTLEEKIRGLIEEFRKAYYGEDVRRTYADIAELVCVEAMKKLDHTVEQGDYAKTQGDYAKKQGEYAKAQGDDAKTKTSEALNAVKVAIQEITGEFQNIKNILDSTVNGKLLLEIQQLLKDLYHVATDLDIDKIIDGTYIDEDEQGSIFETGSNEDIDAIIGETYIESEEGLDATEQEIQEIIDRLFKEARKK